HSRRVYADFAWPSLLTLLALGCAREAATSPAEEEASTAPVKVTMAKMMPLGAFTDLVGTTIPLPNQSARVTAAIEGRVLSVLGQDQGKPLAEGQHVDRETVIVQLDDRIVRANRDKTQAMIDEMEEQKKQADLGEKLAQLDLDRLLKLRPAITDE